MATCVLYRPEKTDYVVNQVPVWEPWLDAAPHATPNNDLQVALRGLTDVAHDLPTEEALCLEIEELCTATLTIDQAFYDIGRKLSDVVKEQNKRVDLYNTCYSLETRWNNHYLVSASS